MHQLLQRFNNDNHTKEAFKEFALRCIEDEALKRMFERKDVSHIPDAKELLDAIFTRLSEQFEIKSQSPAPENRAK